MHYYWSAMISTLQDACCNKFLTALRGNEGGRAHCPSFQEQVGSTCHTGWGYRVFFAPTEHSKNYIHTFFFYLEFTPHDQQRSKRALWGAMVVKTNECSVRGKAIFLLASNNRPTSASRSSGPLLRKRLLEARAVRLLKQQERWFWSISEGWDVSGFPHNCKMRVKKKCLPAGGRGDTVSAC